MLGSIRLSISFSHPWFFHMPTNELKNFLLRLCLVVGNFEGKFEGKKIESKNRRK